jgi:hypothetical protein
MAGLPGVQPREPDVPASHRRDLKKAIWHGLRSPLSIPIVLGLVTGVVLRLWLLFHEAINSDEASVGLMARQILHGHFTALFWGQTYGGVEPYVVALAFLIFGASALVLKATSIVLFGIACVLTYRISIRLVSKRSYALCAAVLVWVWPECDVWNSTRELGFRNVTLCCGLGCLLMSMRIFGQVRPGGRKSGGSNLGAFGAFGLLAGIGWWSSPEVSYFLLPSVVLIGWSILSAQKSDHLTIARWWRPIVVGVFFAGLGALPWIWVSVKQRFQTASLSANNGPPSDYFQRLQIFFKDVLPLMLGLRHEGSGSWVVPSGVGHLLYGLSLLVLVVMVVLSGSRKGPGRAVAIALVAFPLLYALPGSASFWQDGRYGAYLMPLIAIVLIIGTEELANLAGRMTARATESSSHRAPVAAALWLSLVLAATSALSLAAFAEVFTASLPTASAFFQDWVNPEAPVIIAIGRLRADGIESVYADYWVAGDVNFLGDQKPIAASFDLVRNEATNQTAFNDNYPNRSAWLFYPAVGTQAEDQARTIFVAATLGPYGYSEEQFVQMLGRLGVGYRVLDLGVLVAVVPKEAVGPAEVGIPLHAYTLAPGSSWNGT